MFPKFEDTCFDVLESFGGNHNHSNFWIALFSNQKYTTFPPSKSPSSLSKLGNITSTDPSQSCGRPDCFALLPISHLFPILVCAFSLNLEIFMSI